MQSTTADCLVSLATTLFPPPPSQRPRPAAQNPSGCLRKSIGRLRQTSRQAPSQTFRPQGGTCVTLFSEFFFFSFPSISLVPISRHYQAKGPSRVASRCYASNWKPSINHDSNTHTKKMLTQMNFFFPSSQRLTDIENLLSDTRVPPVGLGLQSDFQKEK